MSRIRWFIIASLALNVVFAVALWRESGATPRSTSDSVATREQASQPDTTSTRQTSSSTSAIEAAEDVAADADDLAAVHRELVAAGYPRAMIVRILRTLASERIGAWFESLQATGQEHEYWKPGAVLRSGTSRMVEYYQVRRDTEAQLEELLGPHYLDDLEGHAASLRHRFGPLSSEKLLRVQALELELEARLRGPIEPVSSETDAQRERRIREEHRSSLAQVLSPQELLEYELRASSTAEKIRRDYFAAQLSEDEYRRLFQLIRPIEYQLGSSMQRPDDPVSTAARKQAEAALIEQMKVTFGAERAAEFALVRDPSARQERELTSRLDLPISAAAQLITIRNDIQGRAKALQEDRSLNDDQRRARTSQLLTEAERRFTATLGERGFTMYREYGGQWMKRLTPPPATSNP